MKSIREELIEGMAEVAYEASCGMPTSIGPCPEWRHLGEPHKSQLLLVMAEVLDFIAQSLGEPPALISIAGKSEKSEEISNG